MAKEYHITYGDSAKGNLLRSDCVDFNLPHVSLIYLMDNLGEGLLFDLKTLNGISDRIQWFEDFYEQEDTYYFRDQLAIEVFEQLSEIAEGDTVYIWLGLTIDDVVWNAAILHFLKDKDVSIYVIDWYVHFKNYSVDEGSKLISLGIFQSKEVDIVKEKFRPLTTSELFIWAAKWERLISNNEPLRMLNANYEIIEHDVSDFDKLIIALCSDNINYTDSITIVSNMWVDNRCWGLGDDFILERLRKLIRSGILEIKDHKLESLNERRFYVRKSLSSLFHLNLNQ